MIDRKQWDRAENFIEKYYNDGFITNHQKAEELSRKHPNGRNILTALGEAISDFENSKPFSAAGEPSWSSLTLLLNLMNDAFFSGVLINKDSQSASMDLKRGFNDEVKDFLAKLCEMSNYDTRKSVDAFEVGRELNLPEEKMTSIVNYSLGKGWIKEPDPDFNRIDAGDPPTTRKSRLIFITSEGIDKQSDEEHKVNGASVSQHFGDNIITRVNHAEKSPILIGKGSSQNVVFNEEQIEGIKKILANIEQNIKDKADEIPPNNKSEVETDVKAIKQEIIKPEQDRDNNKILTKIRSLASKTRSLGSKTKDLAPFVGLATQLIGLITSLSN